MASYSALMCRLLPWCVFSPAQGGCGWYFYCCGHRPGLFSGSAICLPSGHWRLFPAHTVQGHNASTAQKQRCVGPRVCTCPGIPAPWRGPWDQTVCQNAAQVRGWGGCPRGLSTELPVQCPGASSPAAPSVCPEWQCRSPTGPLTRAFHPY